MIKINTTHEEKYEKAKALLGDLRSGDLICLENNKYHWLVLYIEPHALTTDKQFLHYYILETNKKNYCDLDIIAEYLCFHIESMAVITRGKQKEIK